jgi:hypothetical protein
MYESPCPTGRSARLTSINESGAEAHCDASLIVHLSNFLIPKMRLDASLSYRLLIGVFIGGRRLLSHSNHGRVLRNFNLAMDTEVGVRDITGAGEQLGHPQIDRKLPDTRCLRPEN